MNWGCDSDEFCLAFNQQEQSMTSKQLIFENMMKWMWHCKIRSRVISRETWVQSQSEIQNAVFLVQASILTNAAVLIRNIQMAKQGGGTWGWKCICLRFFSSNLKASFLRKQIFITSCLLKALSPEHLHHPKMHGTVCFQSPQAFPICHELRFRGGKMLKSHEMLTKSPRICEQSNQHLGLKMLKKHQHLGVVGCMMHSDFISVQTADPFLKYNRHVRCNVHYQHV